MLDFQSKFKRQIEILGLCLSREIKKPLKTFDLAGLFNVEELTIKRDLLYLRSYGIDIHSYKKDGVKINGTLTKKKVADLIFHYCSLNHDNQSFDRTTSLVVEKLGENALANMVLLQMCIDNSEAALIDYNKTGDKVQKNKEVEPLFIFHGEGTWRVVVHSGGIIRQLLFDKILSVKLTGKRFEKIDCDITGLFRYSWKSWFGTEKFKVKLLISRNWAEKIMPRMLAADQVIEKNKDGSIIFQCTVNSLNEIAGWIVSRGEGIKVLEPDELKDLVIEIAEGVMSNY